jgi:hypothetical protein
MCCVRLISNIKEWLAAVVNPPAAILFVVSLAASTVRQPICSGTTLFPRFYHITLVERT